MKDITRIHIAKTPYSAELEAKKELESYIDSLESYTADPELLQDIEIRITELLLERGVKPEDVISLADAHAIRTQLGEPKEFMTDDVQDANAELLPDTGTRTLYRNLDTALLGGVLGGIASYLRIDAVWVRLAFIILFFVSAGMITFIYAVAWLIIPPAHTAAEKLQMNGRAVTLSSIRELNESGLSAATEKRQALIRRVLTTTLGIGAILSALGGLLMMAVVAMQLLLGQDMEVGDGYRLPLILMFFSGALYVVLSLLVAFAAFAQKFNKRIWISAIIIIALGLTTFSGAILGLRLSDQSDFEARQRNMVESTDKLPATFSKVKHLEVNVPSGMNLTYLVDDTAPSVKQRLHKDAPEATVTIDGERATISLPNNKHLRAGGEATLTLRGPAIESITSTNGYVSYENATQPKLTINAKNSASVSLTSSTIANVSVNITDDAQFDASGASVSVAKLELAGASQITLGNIKNLRVKSPDSCAAATTTGLSVESVRDTTFDHNGKQVVTKNIDDPCFQMMIGGEEEFED